MNEDETRMNKEVHQRTQASPHVSFIIHLKIIIIV